MTLLFILELLHKIFIDIIDIWIKNLIFYQNQVFRFFQLLLLLYY